MKRGGGEYQLTCWCPGTITRVSAADTKDGRRALGLDWIYVQYDDGESSWLLASRPSFFNARKPGAWRFLKRDGGDDDDDGADDNDDEGLAEADLVDADDEKEDEWEADEPEL